MKHLNSVSIKPAAAQDLSMANLSGARLRTANAKLFRANLNAAHLGNPKLVKANLTGADLQSW
jgi:uncharacterized protein YjbI with pentapeptide repeats